MINFQRLLGRENEFFSLLEASAQEGARAASALRRIFSATDLNTPSMMEEFTAARRKDEQITDKLEEMLITTFVTPLEREDLEALAEVLHKIPKTVEKFAARYTIAAPLIRDTDFNRQLTLIEQAVAIVVKMVRSLREGKLGEIKSMQNKLQALESDADDVLLAHLNRLYNTDIPSLHAVILKELFDLLEKVVDRCRDAGNVISHVLLKNS